MADRRGSIQEMFSCWYGNQASSCAPSHFQSSPGACGRVDLMSHQKVASFNTILHCRFLCQQKPKVESKRCSQTCDLVQHRRKTRPLHLIYWICPLKKKKKNPEFRQSSLCSPSATGINIWLLRDETVHTADSELKIHTAVIQDSTVGLQATERKIPTLTGRNEWWERRQLSHALSWNWGSAVKELVMRQALLILGLQSLFSCIHL